MEGVPEEELDNFRCPVLMTIMRDPVVAADGHTYERAAMEEWFRSCNDTLEVNSPMTGFPLQSKILFANHNLRRAIQDFVKRHPEAANMMTSESEIKAIVRRKLRPELERKDTPPLIDLRTDEEIASDEAAAFEQERRINDERDMRTAVATIVEPPRMVGEVREDGNARIVTKTSSYTLAPPSTLLVGSRFSHHSQSDELSMYESSSDGIFELKKRIKMSGSDSVTCSTVLRLPSDDPLRSPHSRYVISGSASGALQMFTYFRFLNSPMLTKLELNAEMKRAHSEGITCISFWPGISKPLVVTGSRDRTLKVWTAETQKPQGDAWKFNSTGVLEGHSGFVTCCDVEISSGVLLSGGEDWKAYLWDLHRPDAGCISEFETHSYALRCCSWSTSGQLAVNGFDVGMNTAAAPSAPNLGVENNCACFATGGDDEMVHVIDPRAGYRGKVASLKTGAAVLTCCWGPTEDAPGPLPWLAAGGGVPLDSFNASSDNIGGWARIWDPRTWKVVGDCCSFGTSPLEGADGGLHDATASMRNLALYKKSACEGDADKTREAHSTVVAALTPMRLANGKIGLASVGSDRVIRLWKLPVGPGDCLLKPVLLQNVPTQSVSTHCCMELL